MSDVTLIPKYDKHGSETESFFRYVFGQVNSPVSGVIYIRRDTPIPDKLMLMFNKYTGKAGIQDEERTNGMNACHEANYGKEEEVNEDAER